MFKERRSRRNRRASFSLNSSKSDRRSAKQLQRPKQDTFKVLATSKTPKEFKAAWFALVSAEGPISLSACNMFLDKHKASARLLIYMRDRAGRTAFDLASGQIKVLMHARLLFCGRYKLASGPAVHRSRTCKVVYAEDFKGKSASMFASRTQSQARRLVGSRGGTGDWSGFKGKPVALKFMKDRATFECEIRLRLQRAINKCVIPVLGWHLPPGESIAPKDKREHQGRTDVSDVYPYIVVMRRGELSGRHAISSQRMAGHDFILVQNLVSFGKARGSER